MAISEYTDIDFNSRIKAIRDVGFALGVGNANLLSQALAMATTEQLSDPVIVVRIILTWTVNSTHVPAGIPQEMRGLAGTDFHTDRLGVRRR